MVISAMCDVRGSAQVEQVAVSNDGSVLMPAQERQRPNKRLIKG